ncbi:MAG: hypothetical protein E6H88_08195 [Chloroflexi bacterium]|nr:MAG: hypothetical protein E6H88_08195 [Chloroflexota bacterium]
MNVKIAFEHPTQLAATSFLRAIAAGDAATAWAHLSRETRGLLEGLYAARAQVALHTAAGVESSVEDARLAEVVAPLRQSILAALGGSDRLGAFGVSGARVVDRAIAYVLLLPDFGDERIVTKADWLPSHLLAFVRESGEWLVDLGKTAELSADAELPDPLGAIRR